MGLLKCQTDLLKCHVVSLVLVMPKSCLRWQAPIAQAAPWLYPDLAARQAGLLRASVVSELSVVAGCMEARPVPRQAALAFQSSMLLVLQHVDVVLGILSAL